MMSFDNMEILWCLIFVLVPIYLLKNDLISKSYFYIQFLSIIFLCLFLAQPHINQSSEAFDESSFLYDLDFNDYVHYVYHIQSDHPIKCIHFIRDSY